MSKSVRFAATFLSAVLCFAITSTLAAADVRVVNDPAKIDQVFPSTAKLRMVNVWATWCAPCVLEMPDLRAIDEAFGAELAMAGVSLDDMIPDGTQERVTNLLEKYRIAFPNVYYTGNPDALGDKLAFDGEIPISIVYDAKGKELWRHQGRLNRQETITQLRELLKKQEGPSR
jgi:thiol-disulfide isomerase/thioredoxin